MDRFSELRSQHSAAMRAGRPGALELLLPCGRRSRRKPSVDASAGRAVHAYAVLRDPADDGMAASQRARGQSQACGAPAAAHGLGGHLSEAAPEPGWAAAQDLSVPSPRAGNPTPEPGFSGGGPLWCLPVVVDRRCDIALLTGRREVAGGNARGVFPQRDGALTVVLSVTG
jgi:hypothetical protein